VTRTRLTRFPETDYRFFVNSQSQSMLPNFADKFFAALTAAGLPEIPREFSVVPYRHVIPSATVAAIDAFIRIFDRVTTRPAWQRSVTSGAPDIARHPRPEACFFSAWDFHLSPGDGWHLIECNDNGSGFFFAGLINRLFYEFAEIGQDASVEPPATADAFAAQLSTFIEREAREFFGTMPDGLFLVLDAAESVRGGKFRNEFILVRDLLRRNGWRSEIASPEQLRWDGKHLLWQEQRVSFVVNRSTDFFWEAEAMSALRAGYLDGKVYVAPNPFTYATRSDKRLLEFLSLPDRDLELGIGAEERAVLSAHVPATFLLREDNLEEIARTKDDYFFKPVHGFAGRGALASTSVGLTRLRRLLRDGSGYVAQKTAPKPLLHAAGAPAEVPLWTDLRVWAYRGERFLISARASKRADLLDLAPPGGWLPTFVQN
jgi:hypothetical protein